MRMQANTSHKFPTHLTSMMKIVKKLPIVKGVEVRLLESDKSVDSQRMLFKKQLPGVKMKKKTVQ